MIATCRSKTLLTIVSLISQLSAARACDVLPESIESVQHVGPLIRECTLPGETRKDDVVPRHANAVQVAKQRWFVIYSTHGYRGVDDERSIVYQIRKDAPDGAVVKEGFLVKGQSDWKPEGVPPAPEGKNYYKQHGHMVAFGVPKGATRDGKPLPHANVFAAKWRVAARPLDVKRDYLEKTPPALAFKTQAVEWLQFRLNDRDDDIEILQPIKVLRQKGFEKGDAFTSIPVIAMNQSFCPPVPFNGDASEWVDCNHFDGGRLAVLKYRFNAESKMYKWIETGPLIADPNRQLSEASLLRLPDGWLVATRTNTGGVGWVKTSKPFEKWPEVVVTKEPAVSAPLTAFTCPDGAVRLFTGDRAASSQKYDRDPLYFWDVDVAKGFTVGNRHTIFDSVAAKLPIRAAVRSKVDFCELFPHHGRTQLIVFGVSTRAYNHPYEGTKIPSVNAEEKGAAAVYYSKITYKKEPPALWEFAGK